MRMVVVALAVAACAKQPAAPDPDAFSKMTDEQKCEATAPRGTQCIEEIMGMQIRQITVGDDALAKELGDAMTRGPRATGDEAAAIHRTACLGYKNYADAVFACWAEPNCDALASCIDKRTR